MFADDKSIENFQQLFFEFKKYLELQKGIHQIRIDGEVNHTFFYVDHDCSTYYPRHGGPVLSVICSGLCTGAFSRRTHGKFRHHIAGINVLIMALVIIFRKQLIISPMVNFLANFIFKRFKIN